MTTVTVEQRKQIRRRLGQVTSGYGGPRTLAKRLDVTDATVRHWLSGRNLPNPNTLYSLASLGVSPDWLLFGAGKAPKFPYNVKRNKGTR